MADSRNQTRPRTALNAEELPVRMRIRKGRVMHRVRQWPSSGDIESLCRRKHPVKGVTSTFARAAGPASWWTRTRYWYPDCGHCPE